jgi:predicted RNA-binding protein with RPS1 domain
VSDVVSVGDTIKVKVINVDATGRIKLSRKALLEPEDGDGEKSDSDGGRRRRGKKSEDTVEVTP